MYQQITKELEALGRPMDVPFVQHFFRTGVGQYGEGDIFIAARVPEMRSLSRKYYKLAGLKDIQKLISSPIHEYRLVALFILILQYEKSKDEACKEELVQFYIQNLDRVNNWDLVDTTAPKILGPYFFNRDKTLLYSWANSGRLWHQRIAILTTFYFIRQDHFEDALQISEILLDHKHDLIHKAVGWMLREIGNRALEVEEEFLLQHYKQMPRTMLRYAIEKFVEDKRQGYLKGCY